jgi:hypothetical protein
MKKELIKSLRHFQNRLKKNQTKLENTILKLEKTKDDLKSIIKKMGC